MKKRWLCWILCAMFLVGIVTGSASAWEPIYRWWPTSDVTYTFSSLLADGVGYASFKTAWINGVSAWTSALGDDPVIYLSQVASLQYANMIFDVCFLTDDDNYGYADISVIYGDQCVGGHAAINVNALSVLSGNTARSTAAHEIGHILSLDEAPYDEVLMDPLRNRNNIYLPTQDDINGVNEMYRNRFD